jgi:hypothetical protein
MQAPAAISGADALLAEFGGKWPYFHDAEVIRFAVERSEAPEDFEVVATLRVHLRRYESRGVGTVDYHQALVKSVVVDFKFGGVEDLSVSDFNHQNVIESISFSDGEGGAPISVEVSGIYGFEGGWRCKTASVAGVSREACEV